MTMKAEKVLVLFLILIFSREIVLSQKISAQINFEYEGKACFLDSNGITNCLYSDSGLYSTGGLELSRKVFFSKKSLTKAGQWIYYYPNGRIESFGLFEEGERKGLWTFISNQGDITRQKFYE